MIDPSSTWPDAAAMAEAGAPAILPFGALEQHGPHLPLSTDTDIAAALAERVARAVDGYLLPAVALGATWNNREFPGTVSLSFDTVRAVAGDVARALRETGFGALIVVNGDYGNRAPLQVAAREALDQHGLPVLVVDHPGLAEIAADVCDSDPAGPGFYHADEVETSIMLALRPERVRLADAVAEYPELPPTYGATPASLRTLSSSGVFGDPRTADPAKGHLLLDRLTARAVELARAFLDRVRRPGR